jgi:hypothetical protein
MRDGADGKLVMEDATVIFRNFAGKEGMYNREGDRNFCVLLDPPLASQLARDGWNIKYLKVREEGDEPQAYMQVSVGFKIRPPRLVLVTSKGRTTIPEEMVEVLDWVDVKTADMTIRPYEWSVGGRSGIKAYLQTLYFIIHEDPLDLKYQDLQELPATAGRVRELEAGGIDDSMIIEGEVV